MLMIYHLRAYSDLTIRCGAYECKVHKAVLCTRNKYFATACKPGAFKEGRNGIIELEATSSAPDADNTGLDDPKAVELMVNFLYHHDYEAPAIFVNIEEANEGTPKKKQSVQENRNGYYQTVTKE